VVLVVPWVFGTLAFRGEYGGNRAWAGLASVLMIDRRTSNIERSPTTLMAHYAAQLAVSIRMASETSHTWKYQKKETILDITFNMKSLPYSLSELLRLSLDRLVMASQMFDISKTGDTLKCQGAEDIKLEIIEKSWADVGVVVFRHKSLQRNEVVASMYEV
jgi:hypothetical protein